MGSVLKKISNVALWPLPQLMDSLNPKIGSPTPPPAPPDLQNIEVEKRKKVLGRRNTLMTEPGALSEASILRPTLLGQ